MFTWQLCVAQGCAAAHQGREVLAGGERGFVLGEVEDKVFVLREEFVAVNGANVISLVPGRRAGNLRIGELQLSSQTELRGRFSRSVCWEGASNTGGEDKGDICLVTHVDNGLLGRVWR